MKVLLDFHHHALAESYALTLHDRLGMDIYFPMGMEWFDEGIWQFEKEWHGDRVARQYLLGVWHGHDGPACEMTDPRHPNRTLKGVTLATAREMQWDLVISSLPHNDAGYAAFAKERGVRFGVQVGNAMQHSRWDLAEFIWSSSTLPGFGPDHLGKTFTFMGKPTVMTHQEFSLDIFREREPVESLGVASFVNCFPETPTYQRFAAIARRNPEWDWRVYGSYGSAHDDDLRAGDISWVPDIADAMADARVGWHDKWWGDGFGHVIHNWFAIGRPLFVSERYYRDAIAGPLLEEGVTTFDLEQMNERDIIDTLVRLDDDDEYAAICAKSAARFREVVDFDAEAALVAELLS